MCGVAREEKREATDSTMANAAPLNSKATAATVCRENFLPKNPLIAAPTSGSTGISQRCRLGVIV